MPEARVPQRALPLKANYSRQYNEKQSKPEGKSICSQTLADLPFQGYILFAYLPMLAAYGCTRVLTVALATVAMVGIAGFSPLEAEEARLMADVSANLNQLP